jgi:hypothetical protein
MDFHAREVGFAGCGKKVSGSSGIQYVAGLL